VSLCVIICDGCGCVYADEGGGVRIIVRRRLCGGIRGGFVRGVYVGGKRVYGTGVLAVGRCGVAVACSAGLAPVDIISRASATWLLLHDDGTF